MVYDFDTLVERYGTHSLEYDYVTPESNAEWGLPPAPENFIAIEVADMDFHCAPAIKERLQKVVDWNLYGYTGLHPSMKTEYYSSIQNWNKNRFGWNVEKDEIFYTPGVLAGIQKAMKAVLQLGDSVLLLTPIYTPFYSTIRDNGYNVVKSAMDCKNGCYTVNWNDYEKKSSQDDVKAFILCSPHNPVGRVWTKEELLKMHDICTKNDVVIISDEIHCDIVRKGVIFEPLSKLVEGKNVITCTGPNKSFNLASLQASHIIVQDEKLKGKIKSVMGLPSCTPFVIEAVIAAYGYSEDWLNQLNDYIDANIDVAIEFVKEKMPKVKIWRPEGTYLLWMDFSGYGLSDDEIFERIYLKAGVAIEQGREFDEGGHQGFIRICTSTQRSRLIDALERISKEFEERKNYEI